MKYWRAMASVALAVALAAVTLGTYVPPGRQVPGFFNYFGDGAEPDPNPSGTATLGGEHNYASFTGGPGARSISCENFAQPPSSTLVVRSPGTCTIAGTINGHGAANPVYTIGGVGGGGGGNPSAAGLQAIGVYIAQPGFQRRRGRLRG